MWAKPACKLYTVVDKVKRKILDKLNRVKNISDQIFEKNIEMLQSIST